MKGFKSSARTWVILVALCLAVVVGLIYAITQVTAGGTSTGASEQPWEKTLISPSYGGEKQELVAKAASDLKVGKAIPGKVTITTYELSSSGKVMRKTSVTDSAQFLKQGNGDIWLTDRSESLSSLLEFRGQDVRVVRGDQLAGIGCRNWQVVSANTVPTRNESCVP